MSRRHEARAHTIHPRALKELGEEACIVALGVARDLRSGVIPPDEYDQGEYCGTACCIAGHIATRMGIARRVGRYDECGNHLETPVDYLAVEKWAYGLKSSAIRSLFAASWDSDPLLAADAIERFVYDGSDEPWEVPAMSTDTI